MPAKKIKICPYCGADDVLPFESEEDYDRDHSMKIIFLTAFVLIGGYFVVVISAYIYFPFAIFAFVAVSAWMANRREKRKHKAKEKETLRDYLCMECGNSFEA